MRKQVRGQGEKENSIKNIYDTNLNHCNYAECSSICIDCHEQGKG